jgi:hypothetical protein
MASPLITRLKFDVSRNVGIGTNKPITNLDVSGNIRATNTITATNINFTGTFTQNSVPISGWTTSGSNIYYNTGNVGIGSSDPQAKLDVSGNISCGNVTSSGNILINNSSSYQIKKSDNSITNILSLDAGNALRLRGGSGSVYINPDNTGGTTFINFNNINNIGLYNGANPRIITTSIGVGINKTPSTDLDISGNTSLTGNATVNGNTSLTGNATVNGNTSLTGNATVNGNMTISGNIIPGSDIVYDLGSSTNRFRDIYLSGSTIDLSGSLIKYDSSTNGIKMMNHSNNTITAHLKDVIADGNVTIGNNLTVNGTFTTIDSTTITIQDPIVTLGGYQTLTVNDNKDRGIEFRYYDGSSKIGFFGYDNTTGNLIYVKDATNTNEVFTGTYGTIEAATFKSTVANGTAPLTVTSTTVVGNLNADLLDGQQGSYYNNYNNLTNKPTIVNTQWTTTGSNIYYTTGSVGIGKTNPTSTLDVSGNITSSGNIYASGEVTAFSDIKLKTNITKISDAISKIESINGYTYNKVDDLNKRHMGVIAQELLDVLPEVVFQQGDTLSVAYGNIVAVLIEGIKELNNKIKILETKLKDLQ